ncbi:hypothetical protein DYB37_012616 [Aphanomyces astaci]|uniref:Uncharacterized protein n=1 Tax=Aphanomyces astaci TaxID=112090 RepID=A0A397A3Q6_APHAT|nr:hypothetical protein DYB36_010541 [Aphanomyces astaci]RHY99333.1 hypothetical protein DYB31_009770 [Aphanomyces astaci]RHY99913.1 hypothetical protein DYB35_012421 [Aphanomyces astaci]RHZ10678.1 hypothetical protein DYB26_011733 [Aphanomyces astaci]RHZ15472.1 hypothetical protein DYB37_012616 [Aphanomyces astaci]
MIARPSSLTSILREDSGVEVSANSEVGAKSIIPFHHDLLTFMKDVRREEHILTSMHMIAFMKLHYKDWLRTYTAAKPDPYKSLLRLCQGFAKRYNFSQRVPTHTKLAELEMTRIRD